MFSFEDVPGHGVNGLVRDPDAASLRFEERAAASKPRSRCAKLRGCEIPLCIPLTFRRRHDKLPTVHSMMKGSEMALCYKNLWKLLIDRDMTRKDLHRVSGVSHATLAKMSRGESVTASVLDRICNSLDCRIENVMEIIPDKPCEVNRRRAQDENGGAQLKRGVK